MPAKTKPSHNSYRNLSLEDITYSAIFGLRPYEHKTQQKVLTYVIFFSFHDFRRHYDYKRGESSSVSKKLQFRQLTSRNPQKNWNVILLPRHVQQKTKKWITTHLLKTTSETQVASRLLLNNDSSLVFHMRRGPQQCIFTSGRSLWRHRREFKVSKVSSVPHLGEHLSHI